MVHFSRADPGDFWRALKQSDYQPDFLVIQGDGLSVGDGDPIVPTDGHLLLRTDDRLREGEEPSVVERLQYCPQVVPRDAKRSLSGCLDLLGAVVPTAAVAFQHHGVDRTSSQASETVHLDLNVRQGIGQRWN